MPAVLVIQDAPDSFILEGDKALSDIQIAKTGLFKDPRYGTFTITQKDFAKWMENFKKLHASNGHLGVPVDPDHKPEKAGDTEAVGWLKSLYTKAGGTELWARVEWNSIGRTLIEDKRYAYISPSFVANYKDETGAEHGTTLIGAALTNRPFLSMATVTLSQLHTTTTEAYSPEVMPFSKTLLDALGLGEDADEAKVLSKITELNAKPEPQNKTLAEMAKAEGAIVLSADQFTSLTAQAAAGAEAAKTLKEQRFEIAFDKALNDSSGARVLPAQKDTYKTLYESNPDATISLMETLPNLVNAKPQGSGEGPVDSVSLSADETEGYAQDEQMNALHEKAMQLCAADANLDYGAAVERVATEMGIS